MGGGVFPEGEELCEDLGVAAESMRIGVEDGGVHGEEGCDAAFPGPDFAA